MNYSFCYKSEKSDIPFDTIFEIYLREEDPQKGFDRVNSFIAGGKAREIDSDLDESYQARIIKLLDTKMIPAKFKGGKLVVHKSDVRAAHRAIKQFRDIKRVPSVVGEEGGAGEWGTNKLTSKLKKDTPGEKNEDAVQNTKAAIKREKEADKVKHDNMLDSARLRKARNKNRRTRPESFDANFETYMNETDRIAQRNKAFALKKKRDHDYEMKWGRKKDKRSIGEE